MKLTNSPGTRITIALVLIIVLLSVTVWIYTDSLFTVLIMFYGLVVGPFLSLTYMQGPALFGFTVALLFSIVLFVTGIKFRTNLSGQILAVIGVCGYGCCGIMGLGYVG